jgi:dGTPase
VVWAKEEGLLFHNRLTHSLKVAQVGRRIAENLLGDIERKRIPNKSIAKLGGLDPDTVEAASLAHDLGHPPFGHIAEEELNDAIRKARIDDGFEGNAQCFRIVTKLSAITEDLDGLNLTRATLNAILKYPTLPDGKASKYGCYSTEMTDFQWAREDLPLAAGQPTLEAEVMDWADDIAYAVHDVEDFYRAGLIPLATLEESAIEPVFGGVIKAWDARFGDPPSELELREAAGATVQIARLFSMRDPFSGTRPERARLRSYTSHRIAILVGATSIDRDGLVVERGAHVQAELLKQLTWHFVVENAALATQQHGQRRVVRDLFQTYSEALAQGHHQLFPPRVQSEVLAELTGRKDPIQRARVVADVVAGMTEAQAVRVHQRLSGIEFGPLLDPAVL